MEAISRNLKSYKAVMPRWFVALLLGGVLLAGVGFFLTGPSSKETALPPIVRQTPPDAPAQPQSTEVMRSSTDINPAIKVGIIFCWISAAISALVLLVSFPVFLFSSDVGRVTRAGGLVKTTLAFFIGSAGTILATISLAH